MMIINTLSALSTDEIFFSRIGKTFKHYFLDIIEKLVHVIFISHTRNIYLFLMEVY